MLAVVVRLLEALSVTRGRLELLRGVLQSLFNGWSEASTTGATNGKFGCTTGHLRWGGRLGEREGGLRLVCGGLEWEIAVGLISG